MMGQVILSLEEYDQLKKKADIAAQAIDCFALNRSYNGKEIKLNISIGKAAQIFEAMFCESVYNDGTYEVQVDEDLFYTTDVAGYYVKAVKKDEPTEDTVKEESKEDEE